MWYSESDDKHVSTALSSLSETSGLDNHLLYQVKLLVIKLCGLFGMPEPPQIATHFGENSKKTVAAALAAGNSNHQNKGNN